MITIDRGSLSFVVLALWCSMACTESPEGPPVDAAAGPASPYMGETPPETEAVVFAPAVVSEAGRYEYALSIHPDGDRLLFSAETPEKGAAVFQSRVDNGVWTTPARVDLSEGAHKSEMEAFFSPDGERIFFAPYSKGMDVRIWTAAVTDTGYADPRPLGSPVADDPSFYPVQAADGSLTYTNLAEGAVYRTTFADGLVTGSEPAGLDKGGHAFPAPDGSFMLLDSASLDSDEQRDIFVAFRADDGSWGPPQPLGPEVNTEHSETCPSLSPDGRFLFFSRYDEPEGVSQIYWISAEVIERKQPV